MFKPTLLAMLLAVPVLSVFLTAAEKPLADQRAEARKKFEQGNFKDAYDIYRRLALDPQDEPREVGQDLKQAIDCLNRLGRTDEIDAFRDKVIEVHQKNWRLLEAAADSYVNGVHYGFIVAGEFARGNKRGGGEFVYSMDRDRVRALQLLDQALPLVKDEADKKAAANFYLSFAHALLYGRGQMGAWELQALTDLTVLPDYEQGYRGWGRHGGNGERGAPITEDGKPVYHKAPESYEAATTDGERWRWMLEQAKDADPARANEVRLIFADFLRQQFGVQTMGYYGSFFGPKESGEEDEDESGPYALHTLEENETIAKLANGIKRFELPDEFNFIRIYREVAAAGKSPQGEQALNTLAQVFEDRRQYPKAAEYWQKSIAEYGAGSGRWKDQRLSQIIENWGRFENVGLQPAGEKATVEYRFRNGRKVSFEAHEIKIDKLLADVQAYLKTNPKQLDWNQLQIDNVGYRLVEQNQKQYLGEKVADWSEELEPRENHFDTQRTIVTPLEKPGVYLLTAKMADGNVSRIIMWVADTAIAQHQLDGRMHYFVADAVTGKPIPRANVEFFGYKQVPVEGVPGRYQVLTKNFSLFSNENGEVLPDPRDLEQQYQWIVMARTGDAVKRPAAPNVDEDRTNRLAFLGFNGIWYGRRYDPVYNQNKVFVATDRPVYRPNQPVKFKFWVRNAQYDKDNGAQFAGQNFTVRITNPKGETAREETFQADQYGGFDGEWTLPADATLGQYGLWIVNRNDVSGGGNFRVEEYKKPEFEVTVDAPGEPVSLGETIKATINARYYFGAPVNNAKVHYKVERTVHTSHWYPLGRWDWFYGPGYWWFAPDYAWYPGWNLWGCKRPVPPWWGHSYDPPEVVLDNEVTIGEDGTVEIEIDTSVAQAIHGDRDHKYTVTAEVVDASRRTIVGTGEVLVAREPFKVFTWVDRGFYRAGDTVEASFKAQTLDQKPVEGKGTFTLYQVTYKDAKPVETDLKAWDVDTNSEGEASQKFVAAEAGQYRLSYKLTDNEGHTIEGGYLLNVIGKDFKDQDYQFNDLELVIEKREYEPNGKVRVMINTNRPDSTVLLFVRPTNGIYLRPQILHLDGKSTVHEITVEKRDMPNFFVEAMTIGGGDVHTQTREVVVPPEKRVVDVTVLPSKEEYLPGAEATVQVKLTDLEGKPFQGSTVVTVYDKAVEYISGGSNVPDIKEFFWKWRRSHHPQSQHSLARYFGHIQKSGEIGMANLGAFGHLVLQDEKAKDKADGRAVEFQQGQSRREFAGRNRGAEGLSLAAAMPAAPMAGFAGNALRKSNAAFETDAALVSDRAEAKGEAGGQPQMVEPTIRKNFADTAYWNANVTADENGIATFKLTMPENLSTWKIRTWTMGDGTRVGQGEADVVTSKNLLVRLQAPRFFVEKDEVVLSAIVHNYLETAKKAQVLLELEGGTLSPLGSPEQTVEIAANGEQRVDWRVKVTKQGEAVVRMKALTDEESDAMEMKFPVLVHGIEKMEAWTGVIRGDKTSDSVTFTIPAERRINDTKLEVRFSPTLAGAMVEALPYLADYPYGCTEQTLNRFVPTVITQNILQKMNIDLKEVQKIRTNLNAQELGDPAERAKQWKRFDRNPVFDVDEVTRMSQKGVQALVEMQLSDGGWGWFSGYGERSAPHTTVVVVHGLQLARENDVAIPPGVLERGVAWLENYQKQQIELLKNAERRKAEKDDEDVQKLPHKEHADNLDAFVYMVLIDAGIANDAMQEYLYRDRTKLAVYAKALYGLALHKEGNGKKLAMILENISQYVVQDNENQTAYLKLPNENYWWFWYGNEVEANAFYLKLLSKTEPKGETTSRLVKYLLNNRKHSTYWNSTRDTAYAIEALAEYLVASGEAEPNLTVEVWFDGEKQRDVVITPENLFTFDNRFELVGDAVDTGEHTIELRKKGDGPLYWNAYVTNFTLEDFITKAGLEIKVQRKYYRLHRADREIKVEGDRGQAASQRVERYERELLENLDTLESGDLVEIELEIDSKNDYEYLMFEDMKPAGFEPVEVRSGYGAGSKGLGAYVEYRDERVTFFTRVLARGKHSLSYRMRAEIPGKFSALPTRGLAMYAPELKANSDEIKLLVEDAPEEEEEKK